MTGISVYTERLRVRRFVLDDAEAVFKVCRDPEGLALAGRGQAARES
jgi:hypothetical protein